MRSGITPPYRLTDSHFTCPWSASLEDALNTCAISYFTLTWKTVPFAVWWKLLVSSTQPIYFDMYDNLCETLNGLKLCLHADHISTASAIWLWRYNIYSIWKYIHIHLYNLSLNLGMDTIFLWLVEERDVFDIWTNCHPVYKLEIMSKSPWTVFPFLWINKTSLLYPFSGMLTVCP